MLYVMGEKLAWVPNLIKYILIFHSYDDVNILKAFRNIPFIDNAEITI